MHFVQNLGSLPTAVAMDEVKARRLQERIDGIIAAVKGGKTVAEAVQDVAGGLGTHEQQEMVILIANRLRKIPEIDFEIHILSINSILLKSLEYLNTEEMDMYGLLQPYYHAIHNLPGLKNEGKIFIVDWPLQHLIDIGRVIHACNTQDYRTVEGYGTHCGAKKLKHQ